MTPLHRRHVLAGLCSCSTLALAGCHSTGAAEGRIGPGYKPLAATDEGGLWQLVAKSEDELKRSRFLVRDKAVNGYVAGIATRLAGEHAGDIRVYVVHTPQFNAMMAPNGMMQVWTGLLLRARNEAQLAAVLGHEVGHVVAHHPAERISRQMMVETGLGVVGGVTPELVDIASSAATLGLVLPFSREQEAEADAIGLQYMARAGYDPRQAVQLWKNFEALGSSGTPEFMSTHPAPGNRIAELEAQMPEAMKLYQASGGQ
jgi:beta-barrel assembly-enhancing protease